jgi:hypothetical protein
MTLVIKENATIYPGPIASSMVQERMKQEIVISAVGSQHTRESRRSMSAFRARAEADILSGAPVLTSWHRTAASNFQPKAQF